MQNPVCLMVSQYQDYMFPRTLSNLQFEVMVLAIELVGVLCFPGKWGENLLKIRTSVGKEKSSLRNFRESLLDEGKAVDVVYLDFIKALDTVSHSILLQELVAHVLDGCTGLDDWAQRVLVSKNQGTNLIDTL